MKFSDILGHRNQIDTLRNFVDTDKIPHALLISGTPGLGKMMLARAFAQYIHCQNKTDGDSCGVCASCRRHQTFNNADMQYVFPVIKRSKPKKSISDDYINEWFEFIERQPFAPYHEWLSAIDAGNSQPQIYVEETTEIIRRMNLSNYSARYKIMLMWLPEKMNEQAANKLLKLIEEPFDDTKFILVSNQPQSILPTIYSRTQRINLTRLSDADIVQYIRRRYSTNEVEANDIARISDGNMITAINKINSSSETIEFRTLFQEMMRKAYTRDIKTLKELSELVAAMGREKERRFLQYASSMIRENFIYNYHIKSLNRLSSEDESFSNRFAPFINHTNVEQIIELIDKADLDISRNANAKIVFFDVFIHLIVLIKKNI